MITSSDAVAQQAGADVLADGGGATDAVVAAMLAGATRASPASLLGSGAVLIAGAGAGAFLVDGRARAPGRSARRPAASENPPIAWRSAVPGLLEGALAAQNRFGVMSLAAVVRATLGALRASRPDEDVLARMEVLEALPRGAAPALDRLGLRQTIVELVGPAAGGVFTRDDLSEFHPPVVPLRVTTAGAHEVLVAPSDPPLRYAPPTLVPPPSGAAICADKNGVMACALWSIAPASISLGETSGLALAALSNAITKGVTRRRPGLPVPMAFAAAFLREDGRVWSALAAAGAGDLEAWRDASVSARLSALSASYPSHGAGDAQGELTWLVRDAGGDVRTISEARG